MDFANRGTRPANTETVSVNNGAAGQTHKSKKPGARATRVMSAVLLFSGTFLVIGLILLLIFGTSSKSESKYLNKDKYQAVFLNGGQVYFGKVGEFNSKYMTLSDIYYLRVNQQVQPGSQQTSNDVSLAKLGNELHGPEDSMVINRSEVQFWENLKDDGQVVKAITEYKKNPNAANAQPAANSTTQSTGNQQQTNTTPTTTTPTTTKKP